MIARTVFSVPFRAHLDERSLNDLSSKLALSTGRLDDQWDSKIGWKLLGGDWDERPTYLRLYRGSDNDWEFCVTTLADELSEQEVASWRAEVMSAIEAIGGATSREDSPAASPTAALKKDDFIQRFALAAGLSRKDAVKVIDAVLATITEALGAGQTVTFTGFGKFTTARRRARYGVNPRNPREKVTIPAANVPRFSPGESLKQAVRS